MKLTTLAAPFTARWREPGPCPACGRPFVCGATLFGCWCTSPALDSGTRAALKARFPGCLCPGCLERLARGATVDELGPPGPAAGV